MKVVDGVYTGFVIMDEKDILELRHMIKNYKPISKNDIAFLLQKLEKKGKKHFRKQARGETIRVERLFSYFGIEWYDNTGSPIYINEEGLYQFKLPYCFYHNI